MTIEPTPEAIEAARLALHEFLASFGLRLNQTDIKAMNVVLTAAAPVIWEQAVQDCIFELETARQAGGPYGQSMRPLNNSKNLAAHLRRWAKEGKP